MMNVEKRFAAETMDVGLVPPSRRMSLQRYGSGGTTGPPREIVGKRYYSPTRFQRYQSHYQNQDHNRSTLSISSSITFSEVDSTDGRESQFDEMINPFLEANCDNQPGMPQRRHSVRSVTSHNLEALHSADYAASTDAPPMRPTRQQSVADGASSHGGGDSHAIREEQDLSLITKQMLLTRIDNSNNSPPPSAESLRSSITSTTSSTEPFPTCLHQDFTVELHAKIAELSASAALFRTIVEIRDRKYGIRQYKECFVGSEAVDAMLQAGLANTRSDAVALGRSWMKYLGLFTHVCDSHIFKDKYLFYRFTPRTGERPCECSFMEDQSSRCESGSGRDDCAYKNRLIRSSLRRQSRRKSRHSAPWYSLRQRPTINEEDEVLMED